MKNDLISRSVLIEVLKAEKKKDRSRAYGEHECDLIAGTIAMCIDFVKAAPTAYDVEKVVEQLEAEKIKNVEPEATHAFMWNSAIQKAIVCVMNGENELK